MRIAPGVVAVKAIIREMKGRDRRMFLFERSEFLIPTRGTGVHPKKKIRPCVCSTNLGFSVTSANGIRPNHGIPLPAYIHISF